MSAKTLIPIDILTSWHSDIPLDMSSEDFNSIHYHFEFRVSLVLEFSKTMQESEEQATNILSSLDPSMGFCGLHKPFKT